LFHQVGDCEPMTTEDVVGRWGHAMELYQAHPVLMDYMPYTPATRARLEDLAALQPTTLAAMHGSSFMGDGAAALRAGADMMERLLGGFPKAGSEHVATAPVA